jgi:hypothetical protein
LPGHLDNPSSYIELGIVRVPLHGLPILFEEGSMVKCETIAK